MLANSDVDLSKSNGFSSAKESSINDQVLWNSFKKGNELAISTLIEDELRAERIKKLKACIQSLTKGQREVIYLKFFNKLTYREIAEITEMQVDSVYNLVSKSIDANYVNGVGNTLNSTEAANYYLAEPFVTALKTNNDPRLPAIAIRYVGATSGPTQTAASGSKVAADQFGMPMGSDDATAQTAAVAAGLGSRYAFSQVDRTRMASKLAPMFLLTAAQTNLLLAEATQTGMITGGLTAAQYFDAGIRAHMNQLATYNANSTVAASDQDTYAAARAVVFTGNELREINFEYWIASFLNGPEAWANFRRSGFPALAPNTYPGRTVVFITRLTYPSSEILVNGANVQEAITSMGGDNLDTKVWWNK